MVDSIIPGVGYTYLPDWHLAPYIPTVSRLLELDWDMFVPGHFWLTDRDGFAENIRWYEAVAETAQDAIADGVDVENLRRGHPLRDGAARPRLRTALPLRRVRRDEPAPLRLRVPARRLGDRGNTTAHCTPLEVQHGH